MQMRKKTTQGTVELTFRIPKIKYAPSVYCVHQNNAKEPGSWLMTYLHDEKLPNGERVEVFFCPRCDRRILLERLSELKKVDKTQ